MAGSSDVVASSSSSMPSSASTYYPCYHVFINHGGSEVASFVRSLYRRLISQQLRVFLDLQDALDGHDGFWGTEAAIGVASVHVAIFSPHYAESQWCLDELLQMVESMDSRGAVIIPVFYNVEPSDLRCHGAYGKALLTHVEKQRKDSQTIHKWRDALFRVASISGFMLDPGYDRDWNNQLEMIVDCVARNVCDRRPPSVGLDEAVENIERKMVEFSQERQKNAKLVAIVGTGGSGKTTLAEKFFNVKCSAFDASCFLYVREASTMHRLPTLQENLLKDLLHLDYEIYSTNHGRELLRSRFASVRKTSRFLIILDNINQNGQLDDLLVEDIFNTDSLIIITSRDSSLFRSHPEVLVYEMKTMEAKYARELFCLHAFHRCLQVIEFENVVEGFLKLCDGLPLSLEVCGALLRGKSGIDGWELQLHELSNVPINRDVKHKLQISYDTLENNEKMMLLAYDGLTENAQDAFLDICWFFGGWEWETVASIVGGEELRSLVDIHLVTRDIDKVRVCYTAVEFSLKVSKGLRITTTEQLSSVLEPEQIVDEIKGIWLMDNEVRFELPVEKLDQMHASLRVLALGDLTVTKGTCNNRFENLILLQAGNVPYLPFNIANLNHLAFLQNRCGQEMGFSAAENIPPTLIKLEVCQRQYCSGLELTSQVVRKLQYLRSLKLKEFVRLFMLPKEFRLLRQLTELDLSGCSLLRLRGDLGQLNALEHLNLSCCGGLKKLPKSIGKLQSLKTLNLKFCIKLSKIPESFTQLKLLRSLNMKGCRNLQTLPKRLGCLNCLEDLNLSGCTSLRLLPSTLSSLSSLQTLNLKNCQSLHDLPDDIGELPLISLKLQKCAKLTTLPQSIGLLKSLRHRSLFLNGCSALKELPEELCRLYYTERLVLSYTALKMLPDRLKEMTSLKYLNLERCENIVNLPEGFGKLNSLQELILNSCSGLENLCGDFASLRSLERLILRNCQSLEGKWMDNIVKIMSLKMVDITESWKVTERWREIRSEENERDMVVKFYQVDGEAEKEMMRKAASMVFSDGCLLFDAYGCRIRPSTLVQNTTLVFVFVRHLPKNGWKQVVDNIKAVHNTSLKLRIIDVTKYTPNLASSDNQGCILEPKGTTLSLSFKNPTVLSAFQRILSEVVGSTELQGDYVLTTTVEADNKGIKKFSRWKNISGLLKQITSKSETLLCIKKQLRTAEGNNLKSLRALLVSEGRDFLLNRDTVQVKVDALKGLKVVLLLISRIEIYEIEISILNEMYAKLCKNEYEFEVVWVPIANLDDNDSWGSYVRAASSMPWLAVADPWSMEPAVLELVKQDWDFGHDNSSILVAVDEKGRISNEDAMDMVWRWGVKAYPFASHSWDDLLDAEWEEFSKKSSLEFLFQNLEDFSTVVKETVQHQGRMIWLYGGDPLEIPDFTPVLRSGLRKLDGCNIEIIYIGGPSFPSAIESMNIQEAIFHHENIKQNISWRSLSFLDTLRFWRRVESLWRELRDKGDKEIFVRLRKLLVSLLSLNNISRSLPEESVWIVAMDEIGEMVTARGKDVIRALVNRSTSLIEGIKGGKLLEAIKERFQDGVINSKLHPTHPLLLFSVEYYPWPGVVCDECHKEIMAEVSFFKCSICDDFNICEPCMELSRGLLVKAASSSSEASLNLVDLTKVQQQSNRKMKGLELGLHSETESFILQPLEIEMEGSSSGIESILEEESEIESTHPVELQFSAKILEALTDREAQREAELEALANREAESKAESKALEKNIVKREADLEALANREAESESKALEKSRVKREAELEALASREAQREAESKALEKEKSIVKRKREALEKSIVKREAELEALANREVESESKALEKSIVKREAELEELAKREAESKAESKAFEKRVAELEALAKRVAEFEANREAELEANRAAELEALAALAKREAELEALAKRAAELKANREALLEALANREAQREAVLEALANKEAELEALAKREAKSKAESEAYEKSTAKKVAELEALANREAQREAELEALAALAKREAELEANRAAELKANREALLEALANREAQREAELEALGKREAKSKAESEAYEKSTAKKVAELEALAKREAISDQI